MRPSERQEIVQRLWTEYHELRPKVSRIQDMEELDRIFGQLESILRQLETINKETP